MAIESKINTWQHFLYKLINILIFAMFENLILNIHFLFKN